MHWLFRWIQTLMLVVVAAASWGFLYGSGQSYVHFDSWAVITGIAIFMGTLLEVRMWIDRRTMVKGN